MKENYSESVENWNKISDKKRIISAYLKNKEKGNLFGEDNLLFENIKKNTRNKSQYYNLLTKNKSTYNNTTINDNILNNMNSFEVKDASINNIKGKKNKRFFSPISSSNK